MQESEYLQGNDKMLANLRKMGIFDQLSDEMLGQILGLSKLRTYESGEPIINEGEFDHWLYFIISGSVKVTKGGRILSEMKGAGTVFGEMGILEGEQRSATVLAKEKTMCLAVDSSFMDRLEPAQRNACYAVLFRMFAVVLAERLREADAELANYRCKC